MEHFVIEGGKPLSGSIQVQGAKNSALPIMAATVLAPGIHEIHGVPRLRDIRVMCRILEALGAEIELVDTKINIDTTHIQTSFITHSLMSQMRSSIFLMGPLLARLGQVSVTRPGGCAIGNRPIDIHLYGLEKLGAKIIEHLGMIQCSSNRLIGTEITFEFPSVGATENVMMAAVLSAGETTLINAAREPEIVDLQNFLNKMGAQVEGAGTSIIRIRGVKELRPISYHIIPDRIVTGTLVAAAAVTSGEIVLENVISDHLSSVLDVMRRAGVQIESEQNRLWVRVPSRLRAISHIETEPYPGFPTDMQPQMLATLTLAEGTSILIENIFESRLKHACELVKMGANLQILNNMVKIQGVSSLIGAKVMASDLRAGAALVIAGLATEGVTMVRGVEHIDRGYENLESVFNQLGGSMKRMKIEEMME